jgi:hypothetical protein
VDITKIESDGECQDERELEKEVAIDNELEMLDQVATVERKEEEEEDE